MKGQIVVVRDYSKQPVLCRVSEESENTVYVSSDAEYNKKNNGLDALEPVGFPREDVFRYDATAQELLSRGNVEWSQMEPFCD